MKSFSQLLGEVEEHLGATIVAVDSDFSIPTDEIDGRVVYGTKRVQGESKRQRTVSS